MTKHDEIYNPESCLNKAKADEQMFILLARDKASPATIRFWCNERVALGKNVFSDPQIQEALNAADRMEQQAPWINK